MLTLSQKIDFLLNARAISPMEAEGYRRADQQLGQAMHLIRADVGTDAHFQQVEYLRCHADLHDYGDEDDSITEYRVVMER